MKIGQDNQISALVSDLNSPTGLAFNSSNGFLYAADWGTGNLWKIDPGSGSHTLFASGISAVQGLACDSAGNVYAASYNYNTIFKFDAEGNQTPFASGVPGPIYLTVGAAVPEPSTCAALLGLAALIAAAYRRSRRAVTAR